ncbi:MAG: alpha/beta hydrolase [Chitinophagales bacterium]
MDTDSLLMPAPEAAKEYKAPETRYFKTREEFDEAVGKDFIHYANNGTRNGQPFLVGLSHGQSPSGAYDYILEHFEKLEHPELIRYTFVNSKLKSQRGLMGITDAIGFLKKLLSSKKITKDQILGRSLDRDNIDAYADGLNKKLAKYLKDNNKEGLDYIFLATDPKGRVASVTRNSSAFGSDKIGMVVEDRKIKELTLTPSFISKSRRIAFLATKSEKRRPLAWLFYRWAKPDESPGFLRFIDDVEKRMTVFIDDAALTWPQVVISRETEYGSTNINLDMARPFNPNTKIKRPVVLMVHGFLGLNSFDGLLAAIPSSRYVAAAMHYGTIPHDLPPKDYSEFVMRNIDAVIKHFGELGHSVYLLDHSMGNIYFTMMDDFWDELEGVRKYLKGRVGANPFFGKEAKHAFLGFLDQVVLKSDLGITERSMTLALRTVMPLDSRNGVRKRGINLNKWMISHDTGIRNRIWRAAKNRILYLMTRLDTLPHLNRIPLKRALNRLPVKIFAIQVYSALRASTKLDNKKRLENIEKHNIPILILKSENDVIAKFVSDIYKNSPNVKIIDITNYGEQSLFREHLYHMVNPQSTSNIIDRFIMEVEVKRNGK